MKSKTKYELVADTFLQNPLNKKCVDHIDGTRTNNHESQLIQKIVRIKNIIW